MIDFELIDAVMDVVEMILLPIMVILFIRIWYLLEYKVKIIKRCNNEKKR